MIIRQRNSGVIYALVEKFETQIGSERDRSVNFAGSVNQRFREFWPEIPGCGRNLEGSLRTPTTLSGTRESSRKTQSVANRTKKGGNEKTPGGEPLGVFLLTGFQQLTHHQELFLIQSANEVNDPMATS